MVAEAPQTQLALPRPGGQVVVPPGLTDRWTRSVLHPKQLAYLNATARINLAYCGRRSYKTEALKRRTVRDAIFQHELRDARYFLCAPTHQQAVDIFWEDVKRLVPDWAFRRSRERSIREGEKRIELWNGGQIKIAGLDKPQRIEGGFWDGGGITEYAECHEDLFDAHIYPMMIRGGWIDLESVPEGRGHFYREVKRARKAIREGSTQYSVHHWKTSEVLHLFLGRERAAAFMADARERMDELTFAQEFDADFVYFEGVVYHAYREADHVVRSIEHRPDAPLILCFDFNRRPGTATVLQESARHGTCAIGEVWISSNSNTQKVCRKLLADWGKRHRGEVHIYGDASGGSEFSSSTEGSDWDIVRNELSPTWGDRLSFRVPEANPSERARVNAFNSRLRSAAGAVRFKISGRDCPRLMHDLESVVCVEGGAGEIDKDFDRELTHPTDGVGYYLHRAWPTRTGSYASEGEL